MARPAPSFTTEATARNEQRDREYARHVALLGGPTAWKPPVGFVPLYATTSQDAVCRSAGLTNFAAVLAAAAAAGVGVPGLVGPVAAADGVRADDPVFVASLDLLTLRAWALEFDESLIDQAIKSPSPWRQDWWW